MLCRLCSLESALCFHFFDSEGQKMEIIQIISKHFGFEPKPEDNLSHVICSTCWKVTKDFHDLYLLAEKVHNEWKNNLCNIKTDPTINADNLNFENIVTSDSDNRSREPFNSETEIIEIKCDVNSLTNEVDNQQDQEEIFSNTLFENLKPENTIRARTKRGRPSRKEQRKTIQINSKHENENNETDNQQYCWDYDENMLIDDESSSASETNDSTKKIKRVYKTKSRKKNDIKQFKRTPEQAEAFRKKLEEGDAIIAKFMKIICDVCKKEQKNFTTFKHHCTSVHRIQGFITCCGKKYYRKGKLAEHIESHLDPDKKKCKICNHVATTVWKLKLHLRYAHKIEDIGKAFICSVCSKAFKMQSHLMRHELVHVPEDQRKFKCTECDKSFPSEANLKLHIKHCHERSHSAVCDICGKTYNTVYELRRHRLKVHEIEGEKQQSHQCKYCDKVFTSRYFYTVHKFREHENQSTDVDLTCPICKKVLPDLLAFKKHKSNSHSTAVHKYACTMCDKTFRRELSLKEHIAFHLGQALYSCPHCPRTFTHSSNMHHHRKLKHPIEFEKMRKEKDKKESWIEMTRLDKI